MIAMVLALFFGFSGQAGAMYMSDGAVQNGTTGGWTAPTDGICVLGLHTDGTMDVDTTITNRRDCQARLVAVTAVTPGDTLANVCGNASKNTAGAKYAAPGSSTCVTVDGNGFINGAISLKNNDRTTQMCTALGGFGLANASGVKNTANSSAAYCLAYGWQFRGQTSSSNPLTFGPKGTTQGSGTGYCYSTMNMTTAYPSSTLCPSNQAAVAPFNANAAYDWAWSSNKCTYAKGIKGYLNSSLTKADGTTLSGYVDLSTYTTMGQCLAAGASWANWIVQPASTRTVLTTPNASTIPLWDYTRQAPDADTGCIHCHSTLVQYNADVYRQKDSYLLTGHKNMLRKVTPGLAWGGPNANGVLTVYTTDGTNTMTWGTIGVPGSALDGANPMYYVYGDWMIPNPTVAIAGSNYACANCHSTGFSGGTATTPGVQSIGTAGYTGTQPADAGAGYVSAVKAGYKWDLEGINCSRCHNAAVGPVNATMIAASTFPTTAPTSGGMGALASGTGRSNLCFGCHQSIAKKWPAQGGSASGTTQYDPTIIPTGVSHGAASGRDFNGHVLGNSFLNSVHARYTGAQSGNGSITANSLGENDLTDPNGTSEYNSIFKGYTCYQGAQPNTDVAVHDASGNALNTMAKCNAVYGAGAWAIDTNGPQGTCTTCHDVHNSLFVASQSAKAIVKECEDCHMDNAATNATDSNAPQVASFNHPVTKGTPFDTSLYPNGACVVCHMATQAELNGDQNSMPVHLWRINTNANYSTFPTINQWSGTNGTVMDRNAQTAPETYVTYTNGVATGTATYAGAVWLDLDMACGQCHGGGRSPVTTMGSTTAGSTAVTVASASGFTAGVRVMVVGAGAGGTNLMTMISSISGNSVTLLTAASTTVSSAEVRINGTANGAPYKTKAELSREAKNFHQMIP